MQAMRALALKLVPTCASSSSFRRREIWMRIRVGTFLMPCMHNSSFV
jgi:hypothetical protein